MFSDFHFLEILRRTWFSFGFQLHTHVLYIYICIYIYIYILNRFDIHTKILLHDQYQIIVEFETRYIRMVVFHECHSDDCPLTTEKI